MFFKKDFTLLEMFKNKLFDLSFTDDYLYKYRENLIIIILKKLLFFQNFKLDDKNLFDPYILFKDINLSFSLKYVKYYNSIDLNDNVMWNSIPNHKFNIVLYFSYKHIDLTNKDLFY